MAMPHNYLDRFIQRSKPFNTDPDLWVRFRQKHWKSELIVTSGKVSFGKYGVIAKFESHVDAIKVLGLAGYRIKGNSQQSPNMTEIIDTLY